MAVVLGSGGILRSFSSETPCLQLGTERLDLGHRKTRSTGVLKWGRVLVRGREPSFPSVLSNSSGLQKGRQPPREVQRDFLAGSRMAR